MDIYFQTRSLNVAAYLIHKGFDVKSMPIIDGQTIFLFDGGDEVRNMVTEYNQNMELKNFIITFKKLKEIIRNNRNNKIQLSNLT
jgi:hypothetical protein